MQAVILAGGKGTRLASRLNGKPKPLVDVAGVPLLQRQIEQLRVQGVDEFVVLVNHAADQIAGFLSIHNDFGCRINLIDDGLPRGTAGAVLNCLDRLDERFLVIYGDTLFNVDISRFLESHVHSGAVASLFLHPNDHPHDSDLVEIDANGRIIGFHSSPHRPGVFLPNLVNAALYAVERSGLGEYREYPPPSDFAKDLFPRMLEDGAHLHGYVSFEYIKDLGTPERLEKVENHLVSGLVERSSLKSPQPCVFIDRDGTLNVLRNYIRTPDALELLPGAGAAVRRFNEAGLRAVLITNQPVVARGECSFDDLSRIHNKLETLLARDGAFLDRIYFCPHHPDGGFVDERSELKVQCECRKPAPGLLLQASRDLNIDPKSSWLVGDSTADIKAAAAFGVRSIQIATGEGGRDGRYMVSPDFTASDLAGAADFILCGYDRIAKLTAEIRDEVDRGHLVLIAGQARAGKSTFASVLAWELRREGVQAKVVSLDRWIHPPHLRAPGILGRYHLDAAVDFLSPWLAGQDALGTPAPFYDRFKRRTMLSDPLDIGSEDVLILEGVPALLMPVVTARPVHRLYIRANETLRAGRVQADYSARTGESPHVARQVYEDRLADEAPTVESSAQFADAIFLLDSWTGAIAV